MNFHFNDETEIVRRMTTYLTDDDILISRKALLEALDERYKEKKGIVPDNLAEGFRQVEMLIREQPVAYDIEKVVEQLERNSWTSPKEPNRLMWLSFAINIVKRGGEL